MLDLSELEQRSQFHVSHNSPNKRLDQLLADVVAMFGCSSGAITLVDGDRVLIRSTVGGRRTEKPRQVSFTDFVLTQDGPLIVPDVRAHPGLAEHPASEFTPRLRFLAGNALRGPDGAGAGAIIIWDTKPHASDAHSAAAHAALADYTAQIEWELYRWELIEAKRQLEKSERLYRALVEPNPDAVYVIDTKGRFTSANAATSQLTLRSHEELIGCLFEQLIAVEDKARARASFQQCLAGEPQYFQARLLRSDKQEVDVDISMSPYIVAGELLGVAVISRDISEQRSEERRVGKECRARGGRWRGQRR